MRRVVYVRKAECGVLCMGGKQSAACCVCEESRVWRVVYIRKAECSVLCM